MRTIELLIKFMKLNDNCFAETQKELNIMRLLDSKRTYISRTLHTVAVGRLVLYIYVNAQTDGPR